MKKLAGLLLFGPMTSAIQGSVASSDGSVKRGTGKGKKDGGGAPQPLPSVTDVVRWGVRKGGNEE